MTRRTRTTIVAAAAGILLLFAAQSADAQQWAKDDPVQPRNVFSVEENEPTAAYMHPFIINYAICHSMALDWMYPVSHEELLGCVATL